MPPIGWALGEAAHDHFGKERRHAGTTLNNRLGVLRHVRRENRLRSRPGERRHACQHLIPDDAQGVDVGAMIRLGIRRRLLRRHIGWRSQRYARGGELLATRRFAHRLGDAKVSDQRVATREQHVVGLDVSVNHAARMRVGQRVGDLAQDPGCFGNRKLAVADQPLPQRLAFDIGHDIVQETVGLTRIEQRQDVRMLQLGRDLDLAKESIAPHGGSELGPEHLHRDFAMVLQVLREIYGCHAAAPDLAIESVPFSQRGLETIEGSGHDAA